MTTAIPSLKAVSNALSGDNTRRTITGEFLGFEDNKNKARIKLVMPGSSMDGKIAIVGLEDGVEGKRLPISERAPGKTEKIKVNGKTMEVALKTDWYTAPENNAADGASGTIVWFTNSFISGKGKGSDAEPYQFTARWSGTVTQEPERILPADKGISVRKFGERYAVTVFQPDNAALIGKDGLGDAMGQLAGASSPEQNLGATVVAFDADKKAVGVVKVYSFVKYDKDKKVEHVPDGMETFNESLKKAGLDLGKADSLLVMPHTNLTVTGTQFMEPKQLKEWDYLVEGSINKAGDIVGRSGLIVMSPSDDNGHSHFVSNIYTLGFGKNPLEQAMVHVGLIEPRQGEESTQESNEAPAEGKDDQPAPASAGQEKSFEPLQNF